MSRLPAGGTARPIVRWGEPVMHRRCREVVDFDEALATLVADMVATMRAAEGVGLAANQVGVDIAVFVFACPDDEGVVHEGVVCNPRLELPEGRGRRLEEGEEGCLSLPGAFITTARPDHAIVAGFDEAGRPVTHTGSGLLARCLQHESDHLAGTVFADRLGRRARRRLLAQAESVAHYFPVGWPVVAMTGDVPDLG
jgi:peptide deformylase